MLWGYRGYKPVFRLIAIMERRNRLHIVVFFFPWRSVLRGYRGCGRDFYIRQKLGQDDFLGPLKSLNSLTHFNDDIIICNGIQIKTQEHFLLLIVLRAILE